MYCNNNIQKINIAIAGIRGRMGRALAQAITHYSELNLNLSIDKETSLVTGLGKNTDFDVLIDFTRPEATLKHLDFCIEHKKKIVIGTTGFTAFEKEKIEQAAKHISIVCSPNMSIGVNLCFDLIKKAAELLDQNFGASLDIAITEAHHRHKVDAPSGTALQMGDVIAKAIKTAQSPHFASIRAGDIVGDHTVVFAVPGERIEITHKASERATFAHGALRAAIWLSTQKVGLYDMGDVLAL